MLHFRSHSSRFAKIRTSNFRKVVRQHTGGKYYVAIIVNLVFFPVVKEFWNYVKNWQS